MKAKLLFDDHPTTTTIATTSHKRESSFDYVIVGAGPAGMGVLLGLLLEQQGGVQQPDRIRKGCSIAVVDRGGREPASNTSDLRQWYLAAHPSPGRENDSLCPISSTITGRKMDLPTGQGLGGTSNINAGIVMPPLNHDFASWPEPWKSSLPDAIQVIWKRLEDKGMLHKQGSASVLPRGTHGWDLDLSASPYATLEVEQGPLCQGTSTWTRRNFFEALIAPILSIHPECEVEWILDTQVQRLLLNGDGVDDKRRTVHGVECLTRNNVDENPADNHSTRLWSLYASKAVILCAGAVESPALLLTSGIGPEAEKESSQPHFQGVGRHLKDQWLLPRVHLTGWQPATSTRTLSTNGIASLGHLMKNKMEEKTFQVALTDSISHETILPSTMALAMRMSCQSPFYARIVDVIFEIVKTMLWLLIRWSPLGFILRHFTRTTLLFLMHPRSEGHVSIEPKVTSSSLSCVEGEEGSKNRLRRRKDVTVRVDVGYCRDPRDVDAMRRAWEGLQYPADDWAHEVFPSWVFLPRLFSWFGMDWFPVFCRFFSQPYFHFSGTCAMKRNDQHLDWVVDSDLLRLRGHDGIHICDASVFPSLVSSPPALTCCALGYAFSERLMATSDLQQGGKEKSLRCAKVASN